MRIDDPVPQNQMEIDEPKETPLVWYKDWCRRIDEREKREGTFDVEPPTMAEVVAVCKEVRAEMYAEEQKLRP